jgi:FkbM family methyltransferase
VLHRARSVKEIEAERAEIFDRAAAYTDYLCVHVDGARLLVKTEDRHVGRATFTKQGRGDAKILSRCVSAVQGLAGANAIEGKTFVDVGANIGSTTIPALLVHPFGAAIALEPEPENFVTLRLNLVLNGLEERVTAFQAAASNAVGELELVVDRSRSGKHRVAGAEARARARDATMSVPAVTLDSLAGDVLASPDDVGLVWMDAESYEGHILEGAMELTHRGIPLAFEWDPKGLDRSGGREKIEEIVGESYTHFVDMRRYGEGEGASFQLRPVSELLSFERIGPKGKLHFTDILVLRLTPRQTQRARGSARVPVGRRPAEKEAERRILLFPSWRNVRRIAPTDAKRRRRLVKSVRRRWKYGKRGLRRVVNTRYRPAYQSTIWHVPARDELPVLLNARKLLGSGAVIGLATGDFSDHVLRTWRGGRLISVDPWPSEDVDELFAAAKERLAAQGARSEVWQLTSADAAAAIPDASLDFVYLEPREGERAEEDLAAWLPKLRPGGIFAGYAYVEDVARRSIDEFFGERGIRVHSTDGPSAVEVLPSWIVEIPQDVPGPN